MKFTGLILICASGCLALILPAFGVVQFPKINRNASVPAGAAVLTNLGFFAGSQSPEPVPNGTGPTSESKGMLNEILPGNFRNPALEPTGAVFPAAESPFPPSLREAGNPPAGSAAKGTIPKFGMGVWLLLGPISLVGLAMWSFARNPSGTKSKEK